MPGFGKQLGYCRGESARHPKLFNPGSILVLIVEFVVGCRFVPRNFSPGIRSSSFLKTNIF